MVYCYYFKYNLFICTALKASSFPFYRWKAKDQGDRLSPRLNRNKWQNQDIILGCLFLPVTVWATKMGLEER